ncbi:outer membrane protein assembly factor BamE [Burkholderia sp. Tr-862]|nr:outer membrane protein assembly factor BamE [Burkholderia sp. Tr-862]
MKRILTTTATMLLAAALLNGCAVGASPAVADEAAVSTIQAGRTTKKDVLTKFGQPSEQTSDDKGNATWHYQRVENSALAFLPGLNLLGRSEKNSELTVRFNSRGVVTGYDYNHRNL